MGLDVYLYKYENKQETDRLENEYQLASDENWNKFGKYDSLTDGQKETVRNENKLLASNLGLGEYGEDETNKTKIKFDSLTDRDHYFKVGYFRSSYNESGINRVLSNLGVPDLNDIFYPNEQYCFQPDWEQSLQNCNEAIAILEKKENYRCFKVAANIFGQPECASEKAALDTFLNELPRKGSYSSLKGDFFLDEPLKIHALIPGTTHMNNSCTYVITDGENRWYINALKIVKETIEYVLNKPDKEKYFLHWSA